MVAQASGAWGEVRGIVLLLVGVCLSQLGTPVATGWSFRAAKASSQAEQQRPFGTTAEFVRVDFSAVTGSGSLPDDLSVEDLTLKIDGHERRIATLQFVRTSSAASALSGVAPIPRDAVAGASEQQDSSSGRRFFLVFDHESMRPGEDMLVKGAIGTFVRGLGANDEVAVLSAPRGRVELDLTVEHRGISPAVERIAGHAPSTRDPCDEVLRSIDFVTELRRLADGVGPLPGRKTFILVTRGLYKQDARCGSLREPLKDMALAAERAQIVIYAIQPGEIPDLARSRPAQVAAGGPTTDDRLTEGIEDLVGVTGGLLLRPAARVDSVFERILTETSGYYVLGFEVLASDRDGRSHKIDLRTRRKGLFIRARTTFSVQPSR